MDMYLFDDAYNALSQFRDKLGEKTLEWVVSHKKGSNNPFPPIGNEY